MAATEKSKDSSQILLRLHGAAKLKVVHCFLIFILHQMVLSDSGISYFIVAVPTDTFMEQLGRLIPVAVVISFTGTKSNITKLRRR